MNRMSKWMLTAALLLSLPAAARAQVENRATLTREGARRAIAAAVADARAKNAPGAAIAVVDAGGNLIAVERLDGTFAAGAQISIGKARTAVLFQRPTKFFEDIIRNGRTPMIALPDSLFTPLQGGVPIVVDGAIVGGIGVSGAASAQQDEELAMAGAAALAGNSAMAVTYLDNGRVAAAFAKGMPLVEVGEYKIHASRRTEPGLVEVHLGETDIIYVLDGEATFVTGGSVTDGKTTAPGEIRGAGITGGETRRLRKGDVIVVPAGTPHWFQQVQGTFLYYVVKVL
jgi:glc operon protein GlcG